VNLKKLFLIVGILFATGILLSSQVSTTPECENCDSDLAEFPSDGCTVVIVGKDASVDGSVMTTHTCDCSMCDWTWRYVPAADHEPGSMRKIYHISQYVTWPPAEGLKWEKYKADFTGLEIPQVPHGHSRINNRMPR
jgi:hypothetical protein